MYYKKILILIILAMLLISNTIPIFAEKSEITSTMDNIETILFDSNIYIETIRHEGTSSLLDVFVYSPVNDERKILFEKKNIYKGILEIKENKIIIKKPIYSKGDSNALPSSYKVNEYIYDGENIVLSSSNTIKTSDLSSDKMSKTDDSDWTNPPEEEILQILEEVALDKCIPPVILKSIAYTESRLKQFDDNGEPLKPLYEESYGIMQINVGSSSGYDIEKIKYDIRYNIEVGADILLSKWGYAFASSSVIPKIGDGDPKIMENWYFAIWAYNGYSEINNPNMLPNEVRSIAYQDLVIINAKEIFNQDITKIPTSSLPLTGKSEPSDQHTTPTPLHEVEFNNYIADDILIHVEQNDDIITLRNKDNNWSRICSIYPNKALRLINSNPVLYDGYYRYKVQTLDEDNVQIGWVAANWLKKMRKTDINNDGITNIFDIVKIARKINTIVNEENDYSELDLNYDNIINLYDLTLISHNYGK